MRHPFQRQHFKRTGCSTAGMTLLTPDNTISLRAGAAKCLGQLKHLRSPRDSVEMDSESDEVAPGARRACIWDG